MNGIRTRLEAHRMEALNLLEQMTTTAKLHPSSELAASVSNIARAQMLLADELDYLNDETEPELEAESLAVRPK